MSLQTNTLLQTESLNRLKGARIAIVNTEWNSRIVEEQMKGCEKILKEFDVVITEIITVPGCFEIPFACKKLWDLQEEKGAEYYLPDAIIAFGAVVRGGTSHFEYVCNAVTNGIAQLNLMLPVPVIFGILTVNNEEQAWERLGGAHGHKGEEAAITALKMIQLFND